MKEATKIYLKEIIVIGLTSLSKKVLKKYNPKIIAVTGSVGKTTTKDAIFSAIAPYKNARKSEKSFNSEIGIPLTILGCKNAWSNPILWIENFIKGLELVLFKKQYPDWLVLEIGADRPGDIKKVSEWLNPDIVVLTRLPDVPVHVEYFSSPDDVVKEKMYLANGIKSGGVLIINADDENLIKAVKDLNIRKISYGLKNDADVQASDVLIKYESDNGVELPTGMVFEISTQNNSSLLNIDNVLGNHIALASVAAVAVAIKINIEFTDVIKGLSMFDKPNGRMRLIKGLKNSVIIDDTYNSSPVALDEALNTFEKINTSGRKICVLGDMLELGIYSAEEHRRLGEIVAKISDILVTVGLRARGFADGALNKKMNENSIFQFENSQKAGEEFQNMLKPGDILLVKGSQGTRMEKFVEEVMASPEQKNELLVRQNTEWINK